MSELMYNIESVDVNSKEFNLLIKRLYPEKIQPFIKSPKSQHLKQAFVLRESDEVVGRFCLYHNSGISIEGEKTIQIGGYECVNNNETSRVLIEEAKLKAAELGGTHLIGPMNGSTWQNYRFTINDDQPFFFLEHIHQPYYPSQFIESGFSATGIYASFHDPKIKLNPGRLRKYKQDFDQTNYTIRPVNLDDFEDELKRICQFSNESFKNNYLFAPKTESEFIDLFWSLKDLIEPNLFWLCEDENKTVQAIVFCMPDYLNPNNDTIVVKTIAKLNKPDLNGIVSYISEYIYINALKLGYKKAVHAYFKENNKSKSLSQKYNGNAYKVHHLYEMKL